MSEGLKGATIYSACDFSQPTNSCCSHPTCIKPPPALQPWWWWHNLTASKVWHWSRLQVQRQHHHLSLAFHTTPENKHTHTWLDIHRPESWNKNIRLVYLRNNKAKLSAFQNYSGQSPMIMRSFRDDLSVDQDGLKRQVLTVMDCVFHPW